jgi:hypothetical protein
MQTTLRSTLGLLLATLSALTSAAQPQAQARLLRTQGCTSWELCPAEPHGLALRDATAALAVTPERFGTITVQLVYRGWNANARAGVDVLFSARNELLLARGRAALYELLDLTLSLHAVTQGIESSPSRAPPALS